MMITELHPVMVKRLPEAVNGKGMRGFLREIEICVNVNRPRLVLDCSSIRELDGSVIQLLLQCLEEAMKRNGDVKLAALRSAGAALMELTGVSRLFDIFETVPEAVSSFDQIPGREMESAFVPRVPRQASERVA